MVHMVHDAHDASSTAALSNPPIPFATLVGTSRSSSDIPSNSYSHPNEQTLLLRPTATGPNTYGHDRYRHYYSYDEKEGAEYAPSYQDAMRATPATAAVAAITEEDADALPSYTPSIQLLSLCRRKHLFTSNNQRAKRRNWQVVWLLLDGTALRVYTPTRDEEKRFVKEWKARYCTTPSSSLSKKREEEDVEDVDAYEERTRRPNGAPSRSAAVRPTVVPSMPTPTTTRARSGSTAKPSLSSLPAPTLLPSLTQNSVSSNATPRASPSITTTLSQILSRRPHKSHSTRSAICMRPNTYFKRAFVVEIGLEDQSRFLVQFNDYEETHAWLNAMAIAAPLALDLDERIMVEPSPFPRHNHHRQPLLLAPQCLPPVTDDEERRRRTQSEITQPATSLVPNSLANESIVRPQRRRPSTAPAVL